VIKLLLIEAILEQEQKNVVYRPTARVLTVLELLQAHGRMTGAELARRLEVDIRTVRHYVEMLQDLGIPVEAKRGRYGACVAPPRSRASAGQRRPIDSSSWIARFSGWRA
jgi:biotin operon repressor